MKLASRAIKWINASVSPRIVVIGPRKGYLHSEISNLGQVRKEHEKRVQWLSAPDKSLYHIHLGKQIK